MAAREFLLKYRRVFVIWAIAAFFVHIGLLLYFTPWGPDLGVANSPQRLIFRMVMDWWVLKLPIALIGASMVAGRVRWLAPRGRYQEGVNYPIFTTYTYVSIALCSALFAAAGVLSYEFFDLPAGPAALSVTFFNPIIGFFTLWIGGAVRSLIFGTDNAVYRAAANGLSDGSTWLWLGIFYWWFREETKWGKNFAALLVFWVVVYVAWRTVYMFDIYVWTFPVPALWARMVWFFTQFIPSGLAGTIAGLIASEALIRAVERGQGGPTKAPRTTT